MANYKELCRKLADELGKYHARVIEDDGYGSHDTEALLRLADKALAEPEPEGPTDQELLEVLDRATADFPPNHPEAEPMTGARYALTLELRKARAILARWGAPPVRTFKPWTEATLF